jgi:hypothetical protein
MLDVPDFMGEHRVGFIDGEHVEQTLGDYHPGIARSVAEGKCIRRAAVNYADPWNFQTAFRAQLLNELAVSRGQRGIEIVPMKWKRPPR